VLPACIDVYLIMKRSTRFGLSRESAGARAMVAVMSLVVLFSWVPASAQWSDNRSGQRQPATRGLPVNLMGVEAALVEMTNDIRRRHGLPVLLEDGICRDAARGHSADMLNRHYFSHTDPEGRTLKERLPANLATRQWGENIWTGCGYDPRQVHHLAQMIMDSWMNSPGHRENILAPGYTHLGVGVMAKNQAITATQVFMGIAAGGGRGGAGGPSLQGR
jgi:uncharacterized protein YkwD